MITEKAIRRVSYIGGFGIGWAIGGIVNSIAKPSGAVDTVLTTIGGMGIAFMVGKKFGEEVLNAYYALLEVDDNNENM